MTTEATTPEQIDALLHAEDLGRSFGSDLLDENDVLVEDISGELLGGYVERNNYATVHATCELEITRELTWQTARVRPRITLTGAGYWRTWNLGVYVLAQPETRLDRIPLTYKVKGQDKTMLLTRPIGDSYYLAAGSGYLDGVRGIIADAAVGGPGTLLDGTAEATDLSTAMCWLLYRDNPPTWLRAANDTLGAVNYRGLYADRNGCLCSEPYQSPTLRSPTLTFDLTDEQRQMVKEDRQVHRDELDRTNYFVFVREGMTTQPTSGAGLYIVDESGSGTKYKRHWWEQVESQTELEDRGDAVVEQMTQRRHTIKFPCSPCPPLWHFDVVGYHDLQAGGYLKGQVMNWRLPLDLSDMTVQMEVL